ncbi:hypothetical protein HDU67_006719 [Dinochytrium kinnereticum]|nr:hypothetical protein HDU67_006719 [Dinochytrium kinnereticum]
MTDHGDLGIDRRILSTCMFIKSSVGDALDAIRNWKILDSATVDGYMDGPGAEGAKSVMNGLVISFWRHDISTILMESVPGGPLTQSSPFEDVFEALVFLHKAMLHGMFFRPYEISPDGDLYEMKGCALTVGQRHGGSVCSICEWNNNSLFRKRVEYFKPGDFVDLPSPVVQERPGAGMASTDAQTLYVNLRSWVDPKAWYEHATDKDAMARTKERSDHYKVLARLKDEELFEQALKTTQQLDSSFEAKPAASLKDMNSILVNEAMDVAFELERRYPDLKEIQFPVYQPPLSNNSHESPGYTLPTESFTSAGNDGLSFTTMSG